MVWSACGVITLHSCYRKNALVFSNQTRVIFNVYHYSSNSVGCVTNQEFLRQLLPSSGLMKHSYLSLTQYNKEIKNKAHGETTIIELVMGKGVIKWFKKKPFLTRELRTCARASCRYDVGNGTRSLARSLARLVDSCKLVFRFQAFECI